MKKTKKPIKNLPQKTTLSFWLLLTSFLSLQLCMGLWVFLIAPPATASPTVIWLFQTLPLWVFLPGLLMKNTKNQIALTLVLMVYFCISVINSFKTGAAGTYAIIESSLIVIIFSFASMNIRWQGRTNLLNKEKSAL